jgi:hypothetical protein
MDNETPRESIKIVGKRKKGNGDLTTAAPFLELARALRGSKPFIPKGVHRFSSFEESQQWSIRMMARRANPVVEAQTDSTRKGSA